MPVLTVPPEGPATQDQPEPGPTAALDDRENGQAEVAQLAADTIYRRTFVGEYHNLAEHREGRVQLTGQGNAVYATFQTVRSPVQYFAREQPAVLFTVPEGFRPATPITWEVVGQQVRIGGELDSARRDLQVFRLRVDTAGHVRYVDDRGVDGVGYLRYATRLTWPRAGTSPKICERSERIQHAILQALAHNGPIPTCEEVTWLQLASIKVLPPQDDSGLGSWMLVDATEEIFGSTLRYTSVRDAADLLGLSNLEELHLWGVPLASWPTGLFAPTPRLRILTMQGGTMFPSGREGPPYLPPDLPSDLLVFTPVLSDLAIRGTGPQEIPAGFWEPVPFLTRLALHLPDLVEIPKEFLAKAHNLLELSLNFPRSRGFPSALTRLSADFLAHVPSLTSLQHAT